MLGAAVSAPILRITHKHNALSLKEQSQPLDGVTYAVQKRSMYLNTSFQYFSIV